MRKNNKVEFFGYEGKQTYENPSSGMRTIEMDFELLPKIRQFVLDVMKEEKLHIVIDNFLGFLVFLLVK